MKKQYLAIIFALYLTSACTINVGTGNSDTTTPTSNANTANATNSASTTAENKTANTAAAPKEEAKTAKKTDEPSETKSTGTRVQFAKGETSTSITKDIPANGSVDFLINVQKGQTIGYTVGYDFNDSDIDAFLTEPGLQDISQTAPSKEPQEFKVQKSGDHRLTVNNTTGKKVTITLYLDVE